MNNSSHVLSRGHPSRPVRPPRVSALTPVPRRHQPLEEDQTVLHNLTAQACITMAGRKRKSAPATEAAPDAPASRRRSQRVSSSASAQKSKYFEADSESESASKHGHARGRPPKKKARVEPETESDQDDYKDEPEATQDAQDAQASDDSDVDEDAPPKVTFTPLPKLRETGGIDYADDRLHPNTLAFLADLKANNKRSWLKCKPAHSPTPNPSQQARNQNKLTPPSSTRRRVPPRPQGLGILHRRPHRQDHRRRLHHPRPPL